MKHSRLLLAVDRSLVFTFLCRYVLFARRTRHLSHFAKCWTACISSDYYVYDEISDGSFQAMCAPPFFRANLLTLSVRHRF